MPPRGAPGPVRPSRLDRGTLLVPGTGEGWSATLYPDAREAIIWREDHRPADPASYSERDRDPAGAGAPERDRVTPAADPLNGERSRRRARGRVRRYAIANRCTRLATFTYAEEQWSARKVKRDWARLARDLKGRWPDLAWVRVLELHPGGHGLHLHAGLSRYVPKAELAAMWGHGLVDVRKLRTKRGGGEDARQAARYLAKYATKAAEADPGEHAYEVAQGHQPATISLRGWDRQDAWERVIRSMGGEVPSYQWDSGQVTDWRGPPVVFLTF